jgi:hypothetical protein
MAPCNCGSSSAKKEYVFVHPTTGRQHTYRTEVEAEAAKVRAQGGSIRVISK